MEWSHDFCLSCDRQISQSDHGAYCSQSCRLADLERASSSSSGSPSPSAGASWNSQSGHGSGFYLPPALNFSSYANRQPASSPSSPTARCHMSSTHQYSTTSQSYGERSSQLYSSPSRTSLSSLQSCSQHSEPAALSDKIKNELRDYAGSFDHTRDWKRRMTVY
ncbi:hypothetical protein EDC01DRAFT_365483 [Geopyxis carbonaria]|nr:hypothetical protein EDC01DRAFT_365483 [Geopyxis carbonaria]